MGGPVLTLSSTIHPRARRTSTYSSTGVPVLQETTFPPAFSFFFFFLSTIGHFRHSLQDRSFTHTKRAPRVSQTARQEGGPSGVCRQCSLDTL